MLYPTASNAITANATTMAMFLFLAVSFAQPNPPCGSPNASFVNYLTTDPELTFVNQLYSRNARFQLLSSAPNVSLTYLLPTDDAYTQDIEPYTGLDTGTLGQAVFQGSLWMYDVLSGRYSPETLVNLGVVNSVLGMVKQQDFVVKAFTDTSGQLFLEGLGRNNTARVLAVTEICNGFMYKLDKLLLPSQSSGQMPGLAEDAATVVQIVRDKSSCVVSLPEEMRNVPFAQRWLDVWNTTGMLGPLSNSTLSSTIFYPLDQAVQSSGPQAASVTSVLYNMLPGAWCADDLVSAGSKNSMLGEVVGRELPLRFAEEGGNLIVSGEFGRASLVRRSMGCHSIVYFIDDLLLPPPDVKDAPALEALPTNQTRYVTCNQVVYTATQPAALLPAEEAAIAPSSAPDNSNALAIGLGVGLGCAALAACVTIAVIHRQRRAAARIVSPMASKRNEGSEGTGLPITPQDTPLQPATARSSAPALSVFGSPRAPGSPGFFSAIESTTVSSLVTSPSRTTASDVLTRDLWDIDPDDIEIHLDDADKPVELGRGSFGSVYSGTLRGVQPAAIKVLNTSVGDEAEAAFQQEAAILMHINRDRNIVQLYGSCRMPDGRLLLVMELLDGGDLRRALNTPESAEALAWHRQGKGVALNIARGLTALHAVNVVHRDLKSKNVLLSSDFQTAKIGDVGIAAVQSKGYITATAGKVVGTLAWSAPELLLGQRCTEKIDVYSLGIVLFELATGKTPQRGLTPPPPPSERCPAGLGALIKKCTSAKPKKRPSAREVYELILRIPPLEET